MDEQNNRCDGDIAFLSLKSFVFALFQRLTVMEGGPSLRAGSACYLELSCSVCGKVGDGYTSKKSGLTATGYDVNRHLVTAATVCGLGYQQTSRFCAIMNMPKPMSESVWYDYKRTIHTGAKSAADRHLLEAVEQVHQTYTEMHLAEPGDGGVIDISVSIDGSWQKRGHTSHNGIVTVIDIMTGLIIDFVALSNYCQSCETGPKPTDDSYQQWYDAHKDKCQRNTNCSSGAMEVEGAKILFRRSVEKWKLRYTQMLGDGDAKTHAALLQDDPYGVPIQKLECVNHVTKRMGTALRNIVQTRKAQQAPIGGRGKLTDDRIKKLTSYYGKAIKDNRGDLEKMTNAVFASLFHTLSTDEDPHHNFCPTGATSWCFYQRDLANGDPPRNHTHPLPREIAEAILPVYRRLGNKDLLERCLEGKTQNSNESFHSLMWSVCPKHRWANLRTVDTALAIAVQRFNKGSSAILDIMVELELVVDHLAKDHAEKEDLARVQSATRKASNKARQRREAVESIRRQERQDRHRREGEVYGAGQF